MKLGMESRAFLTASAIAMAVVVWAGAAPVEGPPRYFDAAAPSENIARLTICYPSAGTISNLLALEKQGLLPGGRFEIVGIYHAQEQTDYRQARQIAREHNLAWLHFHEISAALSPAALFRTNAATEEFAAIFRKSDGLILFGGPDLPPRTYGQKTSLLTVVTDPYRHYLELSLIFHLLGGFQDESFRGLLEERPDFPVLGICLGLQTMNAGTGGTLVQDIQNQTYGRAYVEDVIAAGRSQWHSNPWPKVEPQNRLLLSSMLHPIALSEDSKFVKAMGLGPADRPEVVSSHHQGAGKIGKGLRIAAASIDGQVVEALEHARFPNVLGVQFHPDFSILWDKQPRFKLTPRAKEPFAIGTYLEAQPPSMAFHRAIWTWFFGKVKPAK